MRILYYSFGLYLLKLSQELLQGYVNKNERLKCYYGGNLNFTNNHLIIKHETTFYKSFYKSFKNDIRQQINNDADNKLVIKLDIQNYFDNVNILVLLDKIDRFSKPSLKEELRFDTSTKEQIKFYFNFISSNKGGIPQSDNDIISGLLGHIYLIFSDLAIDTEIFKYSNLIEFHKIIRFVDDIFIIINFSTNTDKQQQETITDSITSHISDILHYELGLKLNTKTRLYWLNNQIQKEELIKVLKKVSPEYYAHDDESEETPENKIDNIFNELEKLKTSSIDVSLGSDGSLQEEILKEVYDNSVNHLLSKQEIQDRIQLIFTNFNFDLVKVMPQEIILIISKNPKILSKFVLFLQNKSFLTTRDIYLIIKLLCQTNFKNKNNLLFKKLKYNDSFRHIASVYEESKIVSDTPGYYQLSATQINILMVQPHIIEQIRLRVFNEKIESYSVALNHLLNEIHGICMLIDKNNTNKNKDYNAEHAVKYLAFTGVPHDICIDTRNLFDRRNRNTVSHPGSEQNIAWGVTKEEYIKYRNAVGQCLKIVLCSP